MDMYGEFDSDLQPIVVCVHGVHTQRCNDKAFSTRFNYTR